MRIAICNLVVDTRSITEPYHNLISLVVSLEFGAVRVCPRHEDPSIEPHPHAHRSIPTARTRHRDTADAYPAGPYTTPQYTRISTYLSGIFLWCPAVQLTLSRQQQTILRKKTATVFKNPVHRTPGRRDGSPHPRLHHVSRIDPRDHGGGPPTRRLGACTDSRP